MAKKIIHARLPHKDGHMVFTTRDTSMWLQHMSDMVGSQYTLVASPFDLRTIDGDEVVLHLPLKSYTLNELLEALAMAETK